MLAGKTPGARAQAHPARRPRRRPAIAGARLRQRHRLRQRRRPRGRPYLPGHRRGAGPIAGLVGATGADARGQRSGADLVSCRTDGTDDREDRDEGSLFEERLEQDAVHRRGQVKIGLVRLDLGDHVPGGDDVALVLAPGREQAVLNRVAELWHLY